MTCTDSRRRHRGRGPDRLRLDLPDRLRGLVRARSAGGAPAAGDHPGAALAERDADGAGGLRLPAPGRREGDRQGRRRRSRGPTG